MTNGPEETSLSPEAVGRALRAAIPYVVAIGVVGWIIGRLPLG